MTKLDLEMMVVDLEDLTVVVAALVVGVLVVVVVVDLGMVEV